MSNIFETGEVYFTQNIKTDKAIKKFPFLTQLTDENLVALGCVLGQSIAPQAKKWRENCEGNIAVQCAINNFWVAFENESDATLFKLSLT